MPGSSRRVWAVGSDQRGVGLKELGAMLLLPIDNPPGRQLQLPGLGCRRTQQASPRCRWRLWRMRGNMLEARRGEGGGIFFEDDDGAKMKVRLD
jgi:hypothetical protein